MKKRKSRSLIWLCLMIMSVSSTSCAGTPPKPPSLPDRRLKLCADRAGLCYEYEVCDKKFLWTCVKVRSVEEVIDLTNPEQRKAAIDQGFTCTSERRWQ